MKNITGVNEKNVRFLAVMVAMLSGPVVPGPHEIGESDQPVEDKRHPRPMTHCDRCGPTDESMSN